MKPQELLLCYPVLYQSKSNTAYTDEWSHIYTSKWQKFEHNHKDIQEQKAKLSPTTLYEATKNQKSSG